MHLSREGGRLGVGQALEPVLCHVLSGTAPGYKGLGKSAVPVPEGNGRKWRKRKYVE